MQPFPGGMREDWLQEYDLLGGGQFWDLSRVLFEDEAVLGQTLAGLGADISQAQGLETIDYHQSGKWGIIRLMRAVGEMEPVYFVVHVSRFDRDNERSSYLGREYAYLAYLADRFGKQVNDEGRNRHDVVKPLAIGLTGEYRGRQFPFSTMPFVRLAELHFDSVPVKDKDVPYFRYPLSYNQEMRRASDEMGRRANTDEGKKVYEQLCKDLLRANGLIYHVTDGRMLVDMRINAGDWMAWITDKGMKTVLIAVHDGLTEPLSERVWVERMRRHIEPCYIAPISISTRQEMVQVFPQEWPDEFFYECLEEARKLLL